MGILSRGMAFLARTGAETNSETVTYKRGALASYSVAAVIGGREFEQEDTIDLPARLAKWDVDFIIRVSDWDTAQTAALLDSFKPEEGDRVTRADGTIYRVYAEGPIPAWDYGEAERLTYRIHARAETT